ncbi:unnamed protein product [Phytomonas sp. Hart1]|nr:unnamed protein product [Phytomonas sp. Hart1]|eukprot:CCW72151.1 unnamed protein product [Phytomonas sp. isolate Hart1]
MKPDFKGSMMNCDSDNIFTKKKKRLLRQKIIPDAVRMHRDRLLVQPRRHNIRVKRLSGIICSQFTIPKSHHRTGVPDTDFVLYVAAGPTEPGTIAWATMCQYDRSGRPIVGVANIGPGHILNVFYSTRILAHEILHALGFLLDTFQKRNMVDTVSVRNKPASVVMSSPKVVEAARAHYGCSTMQYVELEDVGGAVTMGSHWKMRNAKDELMAPAESAGFYTAITIAAMEDTGFYKGNYSNAESMAWGKNAGCALFDKNCVIDGVSQMPEMFCEGDITSESDLRCSSDRMGIGNCLIDSGLSLPIIFQYFPDTTMGGLEIAMDYCPTIRLYLDTNCITGNQRILPGSVFSESARCFSAFENAHLQTSDGKNMLSICADVQCDKDTSSYRVRVDGANDFVDCPPGSTLVLSEYSTVFNSGEIVCAPYEEVCPKSLYPDDEHDITATKTTAPHLV